MARISNTFVEPEDEDVSDERLKSILQRAGRRLNDGFQPKQLMLWSRISSVSHSWVLCRRPSLKATIAQRYITTNTNGVARADAQRLLNKNDRDVVSGANHIEDSIIKKGQQFQVSNNLSLSCLSMTKFVSHSLDGDASPVLGTVYIHERFIFIVTRSQHH